MHDHRGELGIVKIVVSGESGGGNLTLATTLKAKRDGKLDQIDGVYAQCPYISGTYADPPAELPSLYENDGYFLDCAWMGVLVQALRPGRRERHQPAGLAAARRRRRLAGLPPHVISVNQLDPLRDEGLAYYRKLLDAGVSVASAARSTARATPATACSARAMPEVYRATIRDIKGFADSL